MKKAKVFIGGLLATVALLFSAGSPAFATVTCPGNTVRAGDSVNSIAECNIKKDDSLQPTVVNIINVIIGVIGLVAVVVVVIGGLSYTTSYGDASKVNKAKDTILYGVIGVIVATLAWAIVNYFVSAVFK